VKEMQGRQANARVHVRRDRQHSHCAGRLRLYDFVWVRPIQPHGDRHIRRQDDVVRV
jgi:hypothetical protein